MWAEPFIDHNLLLLAMAALCLISVSCWIYLLFCGKKINKPIVMYMMKSYVRTFLYRTEMNMLLIKVCNQLLLLYNQRSNLKKVDNSLSLTKTPTAGKKLNGQMLLPPMN